jgi:hypothetical protein
MVGAGSPTSASTGSTAPVCGSSTGLDPKQRTASCGPFQHTEITTATPAQLWKKYSKPTQWPDWDHEVAAVTVDGPFVKGTRGTIKPTRGPKARFVVSELTPNVSFTDVTQLPLATMAFAHRIDVIDGVTHFTHHVTMTGSLSPVFSRLIGRGIVSELPKAMRTLAALTQRRASSV